MEARMFYSTDANATANYQLVPEFYFNPERDSCYNVFVIKSFGKIEKMFCIDINLLQFLLKITLLIQTAKSRHRILHAKNG